MIRLLPGLGVAEARNLLSRARNPFMAIRICLYLVDVVMRSMMFRLLPARFWYPRQVRNVVRELDEMLLSESASAQPAHLVRSIPSGPVKLRLAIGHMVFDGLPDWLSTFADGEQYVSLHRWNWLLRALTDDVDKSDLKWGVAMMRSYLQTMTALPDGLASESYTVGERIANSFLYARVAGGDWYALPADVQAALAGMVSYLVRHIEYHGSRATGNHPLNNARALYLAGKCLRRPKLRELALIIVRERLAVIQTPDGFMREGSSHYQLLFTRWLLELNLAAVEFRDHEAMALIEQPLKNALSCCWFFLVPSPKGIAELPTIGDVSPDCEPSWLRDLVLSPHALAVCPPLCLLSRERVSGWARLWSAIEAPTTVSSEPVLGLAKDGFLTYPDSGWHRLQWRGWTAFWRTEPGGGRLEASHAHQDLCSMVLYRHGREVLIDIGRSDYENGSVAGMHAVTHDAHNSISLDGLGPMLTNRDRFVPVAYRTGEVSVTTQEDGDSFRLTLTHGGFKRLSAGAVGHTRHFMFDPSGVVIEDVLEGTGLYDVALHFQWASGVLRSSDVNRPHRAHKETDFLCVESHTRGVEGCTSSFVEAGLDGLNGWRYPAYGVRRPCTTQIVRGKACLPSNVRHVISVQSEAP